MSFEFAAARGPEKISFFSSVALLVFFGVDEIRLKFLVFCFTVRSRAVSALSLLANSRDSVSLQNVIR